MKSSVKRRPWRWLFLLIPFVIIAFILALRSPILQGSTFSRAPSGYGAWYAHLQKQNIAIQRWQRPLEELFNAPALPPSQEISWNSAQTIAPIAPITLVKIATGRSPLSMSGIEQDWVEQGNVLVLLGVRSPVSKAPFSSQLSSPSGLVKIETRRRFGYKDKTSPAQQTILLKDAFGAVAWADPIGRGQLISIVTPHLAANAYQDEPGNFKFLTKLVTAPGNPIWIDEYLHGYTTPKNEAAPGKSGSLAAYLASTSLPVLAMQALIILLVLIWDKNQRFGMPVKLSPPKVDNSEAYIQALAGVLQKAECSEFVWETVGKAERAYVQRSLGLGSSPIESAAIVDAWVQQTGRPAAELEEVLRKPSQKRPTRQELLTWLGKVQTLHRQLG
jgi:Domain of unknown function (DUF4350)